MNVTVKLQTEYIFWGEGNISRINVPFTPEKIEEYCGFDISDRDSDGAPRRRQLVIEAWSIHHPPHMIYGKAYNIDILTNIRELCDHVILDVYSSMKNLDEQAEYIIKEIRSTAGYTDVKSASKV